MSLVDVAVGHIAEIPPNEGRLMRARGHLIAVFRLRDGGVRAVQPWCPHLGGPLVDGLVGAGAVVCPLHGRTFDLTTGEATRGEVGLAAFPSRVEADGAIIVRIPADGPLACRSDERATTAQPPEDESDAPFAMPIER